MRPTTQRPHLLPRHSAAILTILCTTLLLLTLACRVTTDATPPPFTLTQAAVLPETQLLELGFDNPNDEQLAIDLEFYLQETLTGTPAASRTLTIPAQATDHRLTIELDDLPDAGRTLWYRLRATRTLAPDAQPTEWLTTAPASTQPLRCTTSQQRILPETTFMGMRFGYSLDYTPGEAASPCSGRLAIGTANLMEMYEYTFDDIDAHHSAYVAERGTDGWEIVELPVPILELDRYDDLTTLVRISGDTLLMATPSLNSAGGAPAPSVHIFTWDGTDWNFLQTIETQTSSISRSFGFDIVEDVVMIGAPGATVSGLAQAGSVGVYTRSAGSGLWELTQELVSEAGPAGSDRFGYDLRMDGERAVIGSVGCGLQVFTHEGSGTWSWEGSLELSDSDLDSGWYQQSGFAIAGDTVVAYDYQATYGSYGDGAAIVFTFDGTEWSQTATLPNVTGTGSANDTVATSGDRIAVGTEDRVRIYRLTAGNDWEEWSALSPLENPEGGSAFGSALVLHDQGLFIGAHDLTVDSEDAGGGVLVQSVR